MPGYAVVDVETTGRTRYDRVIEIAVVHLDPVGNITGDWCTLVNPRRDLGARDVHGIAAADVRDAPDFADVAGVLVGHLAGRVVVGHNIAFDLRMVEAEYVRLGQPLGLGAAPAVCTLALARQLLRNAANRRLATCCAALGIPLDHAHSALDDATATARLFACFLGMVGQPLPWHGERERADVHPWPDLPATPVVPVLRGHAARRREHFIARIVEHLPWAPEPPEADAYLAVLDDVLLDGQVSRSEEDALVETAEACGLDRRAVAAVHADYLRALAVAAWADGVVTETERAELTRVGELLALPPGSVDEALRAACPTATPQRGAALPRPRSRLRVGDTVVLTGTMDVDRDVWIDRAVRAGLRVGSGVTKKTRIVVAADPDSESAKARKARAYGIPIVAEGAFGAMLNEVERGHDTAGVD